MAKINYDENGNILNRTDYDDNGRITAYTEYDGERVVKAVDYTGDEFPMVVTRYEYGVDGRLSSTVAENYGPQADVETREVTVYDRSGNVESLTAYDVENGANGTRTETAHDEDGRVVEVIRYGIENFVDGVAATAYEYDGNGNVSREETRSNILYFGGEMVKKHDEIRPTEVVTYDRDDSGRITAEDHTYYDGMSNFEVDEDGWPGSIVRWDRIEYEYGGNGGVARQNFYDKSDGLRFEKEYDENGNLAVATDYAADGAVSEKTVYDSDGNISENTCYDEGRVTYEEKAENGIRTSVSYNEDGNPTIRVEINRNERTITGVEYEYDNDGKLKEVNEKKYENFGRNDWQMGSTADTERAYHACDAYKKESYNISRSYNKNGEQTECVKNDYSREDKTVTTEYDGNNKVLVREEVEWDKRGMAIHAVRYEYDKNENVVCAKEYGGSPAYLWPKTMVSQTTYDEDGTAVRTEYDKDGKEISRTKIEDDRADRGVAHEDDGPDVDNGTEAGFRGEDDDVDSDDGDRVD